MNRLLRSLPWCFFNPSAIVCLSLIHGGAWRKNKVLRGLISGCSAGCGHDGPPLFNGMTLFSTDIMDDDHITNTRGVLAACAARGCRKPLDERRSMVCCAGRRDLARWCCDTRYTFQWSWMDTIQPSLQQQRVRRASCGSQRESRANGQLAESCAACGRARVCACHMMHVKAGFESLSDMVADLARVCALYCRVLAATPSRRLSAIVCGTK